MVIGWSTEGFWQSLPADRMQWQDSNLALCCPVAHWLPLPINKCTETELGLLFSAMAVCPARKWFSHTTSNYAAPLSYPFLSWNLINRKCHFNSHFVLPRLCLRPKTSFSAILGIRTHCSMCSAVFVSVCLYVCFTLFVCLAYLCFCFSSVFCFVF